MSLVTIIYAILFYLATIIMAAGMAFKIYQYYSTPAPLKIPVTPAPLTTFGVITRLIYEVAFFRSLFFSNKWLWIFAVLFHAGLLLVILRHLRYFHEPVFILITLIQPFGIYAGFAMVGGLLLLWSRRIFLERIRYISKPSDHLILLLLILIGLSGFGLKFGMRTDIIAVKAFFLGLIYFNWQELPGDILLLVHLGLVIALMIILPFSKLLHIPGIFFSPSRLQKDDAREKRHIVPWMEEMMQRVDAENENNNEGDNSSKAKAPAE